MVRKGHGDLENEQKASRSNQCDINRYRARKNWETGLRKMLTKEGLHLPDLLHAKLAGMANDCGVDETR